MTIDEQNACLERWLQQHAAVLHHVVNGFAEGADRSDLMQELLLALWRAVPLFRQSSHPSTFIYRVAHNAALTWKRAQRNYQHRVDRFSEHVVALSETTAAGEDARDHETLEHLYRAIRRLPPLDRSLILLHLDSLSYAEMADIHGLSESNVGARLSRIKQKLVESMKSIAHELR